MHVEPYMPVLREPFIRYCRSQARFLDETHLHQGELNRFQGGIDDPTFVLLNDNGEVQGAASVLWRGPLQENGIARFRIFHCWRGEFWHYQMLWSALVDWAPADLKQWMHFIPQENSGLRRQMTTLGFQLERYSFLLERTAGDVKRAQWPEGFRLQCVASKEDEREEFEVRRRVFPMLQAWGTDWLNSTMEKDSAITLLLRDRQEPVGVVVMDKAWHRGADWNQISVLAIVPEYQGKGLGRQLLRAALDIGTQKGLGKTILAVNAQNRNAINLYLQEEFAIDKVLECWSLRP